MANFRIFLIAVIAILLSMSVAPACAEAVEEHLYGVALVASPDELSGGAALVATLERQTTLRFRLVMYGEPRHGLDMSHWWAPNFCADVTGVRQGELQRLLAVNPPFVLHFGKDTLPAWAQEAVNGYVAKGGVFLEKEVTPDRLGQMPGLPNATQADAEEDRAHLWAEAFERLVRARCNKALPFITITTPRSAPAGTAIELQLAPTGAMPVKCTLAISDCAGNIALEKVVTLETANASRLTLALPATLPAGACQITLRDAVTGRELGCAYLVIEHGVTLALKDDGAKHGAGETATVTATIGLPASSSGNPATLQWVVRDYRRGVIDFREETLPGAAGEPLIRTLEVPLLDDAEPAWVYWVQAVVARDGVKLAEGEQRVYRWRRFDAREQLVFGSWWCNWSDDRHTPASFRLPALDYLQSMGLNGLSNNGGEELERAGFRVSMEQQATTVLGVGPINSRAGNLAERATPFKKEGEQWAARLKSPMFAMFCIGEESGYGPWSSAYPWDTPEAPERPSFWFREYLKQRYATLEALNASWGTAFTSWDEVKYRKKYAEPRGFLYNPPAHDVENNLAPYIDHHGFAEFNIDEHVRQCVAGLQEADPVIQWTKSFEFTFPDWCSAPMTDFCCSVDPHGTALWNAYARRRTPGAPPFYHLDWAFYDDEAKTRQFWLQGLISGSTYMDNWGELMNWDLTHTRASRCLADLRARLAPVANGVLKMLPVDDERVGIFTQDTPWRLVRGRPAYFLKGRSPEAVSYGPTIESPCCASYLMHADGPLFAALTAAGYAPRFITPAEIPQCKIIFMPYIEALSAQNARRLADYVANGGVLVALPRLAEYDELGHPFAATPGAGLDNLFGLNTGREWIGRQSIVPLPGFDAAAKMLLAYYEPGKQLPEQQKAEVLSFDLTPSCFGEPMRLVSQAHVTVQATAPEVKVLCKHEDGQPALTWRKNGKGQAIFLNVLRSWPGQLYYQTDLYDAAYAQVIRILVEHAGVKPYAWFEDLNGVGEVAPQLTTYQYRWGDNTRILGVFNDWRATPADTRLVFAEPVKAVYDMLHGTRLAVREHLGRSCVFVHVAPGDGTLLACLPYEVRNVAVSSAKSRVVAGEPLEIRAVLKASVEAPDRHPGQLTVIGPDGNALPRAERNLWLDGTPLRVPTYLDAPAGTYRIVVRDCASRVAGEVKVTVTTCSTAAKLPAPPPFGWPSWRRERFAVSAGELADSYTALAALYTDEQAHPTFAYCYYVQELDRSRHRLGQLLAMGDVNQHAAALRALLARGKQLIVLGEDCGIDPLSGEAAVPLTASGLLAAVQQLRAEKATRLYAISGLPDVLVVQRGDGRLVLDRRSPDRLAGTGPMRMNQWISEWRAGLRAAGLLPGQQADPGRLELLSDRRDLHAWMLQR